MEKPECELLKEKPRYPECRTCKEVAGKLIDIAFEKGILSQEVQGECVYSEDKE